MDPKDPNYIGTPLTMEEWEDMYGTFVDPREQFWDDQSFSGNKYAYPYSQVDDRAGGRNRPWINTEEDLKFIRGVGRFLHEIDSTSIGVMGCLSNYIIHTGLNYTVVGERNRRKTGVSQAWIEDTQRVIDDILDKNSFVGDLESELFLRSRRDGEFFVAIYESDGIALLRCIEPEQVTEPTNKSDLEDMYTNNEYPSCWLFGVHTNEQDIEDVRGYHVTWNSTRSDTEYFQKNEICHMKCNVDRKIKRGVSDYFPVYRKLSRLNELATNTVEGAAVQAAIAFIREHVPNVRSDQVQDILSGNATVQKTVAAKNGTTRQRFVERLPSRSVKDIPNGMKYHPGPQGQANGPNYILVIQAALRDVGVRWNMPEYMISGDASNANYSSTMVAESPFVKACVKEQRIYGKKFSSILWEGIRIACESGKIAVPFEQLKRAVDINVEYPDVAVRNLNEETTRREAEHRAGVLSLRTWAKEAGRDYDSERENIAKEPKPEPVMPFGQNDNEDGSFQNRGAMRGAIQGAIEEADEPETLRHLLMEAANWDESKHPRADNGRFISAGEIKAAKSDPKKAAELRAKTTNPEERAKLEKALAAPNDKGEKPLHAPMSDELRNRLASEFPELAANPNHWMFNRNYTYDEAVNEIKALVNDPFEGKYWKKTKAMLNKVADKAEEKAAKGEILPLTLDSIKEKYKALKSIDKGAKRNVFPMVPYNEDDGFDLNYEPGETLLPDNWHKAKTYEVPLTMLKTTQSWLEHKRIYPFLKKGLDPSHINAKFTPTLIYEPDHGLVIHDGNHRLAFQKLGGAETAKAKIFTVNERNTDEFREMTPEEVAKILKREK